MNFEKEAINDTSGFVLLSDYVPSIVQEIRYYSTYNFIGDVIHGQTYYISKTNGLMPQGLYTFDSEGRLVLD